MILAYAGRRAHSLSGDPVLVGERVRRLVAALQPVAVVGAAADGADLLVLEAVLATAQQTAVHIVLPTTREVFSRDSVEPAWRDRFEAVLDVVTGGRGTVQTLDLDPGEAAYREANRVLLDLAAELAADGQRAVALAIAHVGEGQIVEDFVHRAQLADIPTLRIDPTVVITDQPRCFVAMPYGTKPDPQRGITVDCDAVYAKVLVPALEHAQLNYRRGDEEIDSGIVLEPMIEWLATADLVVADLGTGNFNVGWELGLRHLLRSTQTVLLGPAGTRAPFDVAALRHVRYLNDDAGITDEAAIAAWRSLAPHLGRAGHRAGNDSPVASVMDVQHWGVVGRRTPRDEQWEALRQQLALARDLRDADLMRAVVEQGDGLDTDRRRLLRAEAGVGLVRLGEFVAAQPLLREIVQADPEALRAEAHVYYAQSLYRPESSTLDALDAADQVLKRLLVKQPTHPEVRALLGAVLKRRMSVADTVPRRADLLAMREYYSHDLERNLSLYYEGINVVAIDAALAVASGDRAEGVRARELLPTVRLAARLAAEKPDERYWALATLAECALHEHLLGDAPLILVHEAYELAGQERPPQGFLDSSLRQLDFLARLGLPGEALADARQALLIGAGRDG